MSLVDSIKQINNISTTVSDTEKFREEYKKIKVDNKDRKHRIKAFIITLLNHGPSTLAMRRCLETIAESGSLIDPYVVDATTPRLIRKHLASIYPKDIADSIQYTWPVDGMENYCPKTNLYRKAYGATDWRKIMACTVSHLRLWNLCVDLNEPIMILESDTSFIRTFSYDVLTENDFKGICGLNEPYFTTRKPRRFNQGIVNWIIDNDIDGKTFFGLVPCPSVDDVGDKPLPQGLAGNSAYVIKPWAAKLLIDKTAELGIWPNDAVMCKQLFPFLQVTHPYYTRVQRTESTTLK